jgi:hypothetical protein
MMVLVAFDVLWQGEGGGRRERRRLRAGKMLLTDQKESGWCTLDCARESKMEISVYEVR